MTAARLRARIAVSAPVLLCLATGCCTTFERDWRQARCAPAPVDELAGVWEGTWESDRNGHNGTLRAIITRCGENQYSARYHATFCEFLPYAYDTCHVAVDVGGGIRQFQGETDLGWLAGGVYQYSGWANGEIYEARYQTEHDCGVFRMCRKNAIATRQVSHDVLTPTPEPAPIPSSSAPRTVSPPMLNPAPPAPATAALTADPFDDSLPAPPPSPR